MRSFIPVILLSLALSVPSVPSFSQIGGNGTYKFLGVSSSARVAGLGGNFLAVNDNDITLTLANPSLIRPEMSGTAALGYVNIPGGIHYGFVAYGQEFKTAGTFVGSLQFVNYGKFTGADESGNLTGDFGVSEYALNVGWGRRLMPVLSIGANAKLIYSQLESYRSFGIAVDVSGTYTSKDEAFTASLLGRNIGSQLVPYLPGKYEALPFELQIGLSEKMKHIPLRFSQLLTNLNHWDLTYFDAADQANKADPITGEVKKKSGAGKIADGIMRHIVIGAELTIAKVLDIRIGYNYQRRQELKLSTHAGMTGFTFGAGLRIKMFSLGYTRASYTAGIPMNYLTLGINFKEFTKKQ
ncbi:MAG TPA: type IX secretion system protein PorQ [Bacteroidales bacterium]|nr:type IX secretion system protein PorQ [Bacteroidales bacterium]HPS62349.1 type IX secretion system protein PorQ [Bacteroidales bacterium]